MTDDEACKLQPGSIVYFMSTRPCAVLLVYERYCVIAQRLLTWVRLAFYEKEKRVIRSVRPRNVYHVPKVKSDLDPVTSNVFADFLEERGEDRAATLLREAFPFCNERGESPGGKAKPVTTKPPLDKYGCEPDGYRPETCRVCKGAGNVPVNPRNNMNAHMVEQCKACRATGRMRPTI